MPLYQSWYSKEIKMTIYTVNEVSAILKLSRSCVYKMAERGDIPSLKIRTARRFTEEQIRRFIEQCQTAQSTGGKPDEQHLS
jgi:excisionase family DNA binding protein